jgi:hypothetical protein
MRTRIFDKQGNYLLTKMDMGEQEMEDTTPEGGFAYRDDFWFRKEGGKMKLLEAGDPRVQGLYRKAVEAERAA